MPPTALEILKTVYGYDAFRGPQADIVAHVISGNNAFVLMPTGGGKSLCYQIPAIVRPGMGLVVSPLLALTADQVAALRQLAAERPYMDLSRVGVFGISYGGYTTIRAMLQAPDFYKVGVATSPITDMAQHWGNEVASGPIEANQHRGLCPGDDEVANAERPQSAVCLFNVLEDERRHGVAFTAAGCSPRRPRDRFRAAVPA